MPRMKRSFIWDFFTKNDTGEAQCDTCLRKIAVNGGSTSNLIKHLKCKHKDIWPDQSSIDNDLMTKEAYIGKEEYIVLQGENYEYLQEDDDKLDMQEETRFEILPAPKPKKPKVSLVDDEFNPKFSSSRSLPSKSNRESRDLRESRDMRDDSLEIFSRYMISLMRDIPKKKCEEAQLKIVSVILEAKRDVESQEKQEVETRENVN